MSDTKHPAEVLAKDLSEEWLGGVDGDIRDMAVDMLRRIPVLEAVADELAALRSSDLAAYKTLSAEIARLTAALGEAMAEASVSQLAVESLRVDAERWRTFRTAGGDLTLGLHNSRGDMRDSYIDRHITQAQKDEA